MSAFNPLAAVVVHSLVTIETAVLTTLQAEDGLLIEKCSFAATRQERSAVDIAGREFLRVYGPLDALWTVQARALSRTGLANYHPGRKLTETSLAFANGGFIPFQVGTTFPENQNGQSVFIYENPSLDPGPGDLPSVSFGIRVAFADEDILNYPTTNPSPPETPTVFTEIPAQTAGELTVAARNALLNDVFSGISAWDDVAMTAELYDGDPATTGTRVFGPKVITAFLTWDEPTHPYQTRLRNDTQIEWDDANYSDVNVSHVRISRNGIVLRDIALTAVLPVPAYAGVRAPVNSLGVLLTWPIDGGDYGAGDMPSRSMGIYAMGGTRAAANLGTTLIVRAYDGDPVTTGTQIDMFTVNSDGSNFTIVGVTSTVNTTGNINSSGSDWSIAYVEVEIGAFHPFVLKEKISPPLSIPNGSPLVLSGVPILDLSATPDP